MAGANHFQRTREKLSVLKRDSKYRQTCKDGYRCRCKQPKCGHWEAHHIACNHAVEGREIKKNKAYVENCLWITDWDLNAKDNLVGLPLKAQYIRSSGRSPVNLCAHNVDHNTDNGYTDECKLWLKDNVWDTLNDKQKEHDVNADDIKKQLEKCTTEFKKRLEKRGERKGGTYECFRNRHDPAWANKWYHPFSMAKIPNPRRPGTARDLSKIFEKIG